ncbi:quinone oxidoreductase family protein [Streptomyces indicus]|uniref:quinone oxidoreductase family protein n=1 Tax=Streptomyces indicus TaxID=417292 RepID=UPI001FE4C671|nr:zinc-binding dehydrogenase [Streptomyces indicus]
MAIRVQYAGLQWGDVLVRNGHFPVPRPFVPGFEAAGRITAVGAGVDPDRVGEHVAVLTSGGAFAEVVVAPAPLAFPARGLDARTAAASGWAAPTAYDLIHTVTRVRSGESVLIHAALGGVGSLAAQFARAAGASRVIGTVADPDQAEYASRLGYDRLVSRHEFPASLGGDTFDVILDPIGGPTRLANVDHLAPHGRLAVYGNMATFEPVRIGTNDLLMSGQSVLTYNGSLLSRTHPERIADAAGKALRLLADGQAGIDISAEYELAELATGIERLAKGGTRGKGIVRIA